MSIFDAIAKRSLPQSVFDLSHEHKLSCNMGELIPILLEEVLPGDTFQCKTSLLIRLAPMLAPVYHRINAYVHYFYVPNRLVWDNWHDHITGGEDGTANPEHPYMSIQDSTRNFFGRGSLADYLGIPPVETGTTFTDTTRVSSLPFRGYQLIYNEYYRDVHLVDKVPIDTSIDGNEPTVVELGKIRNRAWEKDYFTSARPDAQLGPQVLVPIAGQFSPQYATNDGTPDFNTGEDLDGNGNVTGPATSGAISFNAGNLTYDKGGVQTNANLKNLKDPQIIDNVQSTIEDQRRANRLQEWLELAMRGGSRINEIIRNFFDEVPDDLRLTRPQYLGGGKQPVVFSEVLNSTADQTGTTLQPLGEYGGHGISVGNTNQFRKKFKEHGYIFGIMSIIPKSSYYQGIHKHWTKFDKYEKYWPQFANIGEQEIQNREIFAGYDGTPATQEATFGYAPRYSEYKYKCSQVSGDFRKDADGDNLSYWHMGRHFPSQPNLGQTFVETQPNDLHNIFAVTDPSIDKLYVQAYHNFKAKRKMPYHNLPSNMPVI